MLAELGTLRGAAPPPMMAQSATGLLAQGTLDLLPVAICIVDEDSHILHRNAAAAVMLHACVPIFACQARLKPSCPAANVTLASAIRRVARAEACQAIDASIALPCRDGRAAVAHLRSLDGGTVAVFVTTPVRRAPDPPMTALTMLFGLTKTEARVLEQIVAGCNRREAAAALRVSDATVATHLKGIFAKTGTADQLGLCRKIAALSWPA